MIVCKEVIFVKSKIIEIVLFQKTSSGINIGRCDIRKVINDIGGEFYASQS